MRLILVMIGDRKNALFLFNHTVLGCLTYDILPLQLFCEPFNLKSESSYSYIPLSKF